MEVVEKTCRRCNLTKPISEIKRDARNKDGYSSFCKLCHQAASVAWQKANPERLNATRNARYARKKDAINAQRKSAPGYKERVRWNAMKWRYSITREKYIEMFEAQGGCCAICRKPQSEFERAFSVDHDHKCCPKLPACGECTRGLLCHLCNTALHSLEKNGEWARSAVKYLGGFGK